MLINKDLDYWYALLCSEPSPDQPAHEGCVHAGILQQTQDGEAINLIGNTCSGFEEIGKMADTQTRTLLNTFSYAFLPVNGAYYIFKKIMQQIVNCEKEMLSVRDVVEEEDYMSFNEWLSVSVASYVAGDDEQLLSKFRRKTQSRTSNEVDQLGNMNADILVTTAIIEFFSSKTRNLHAYNRTTCTSLE